MRNVSSKSLNFNLRGGVRVAADTLDGGGRTHDLDKLVHEGKATTGEVQAALDSKGLYVTSGGEVARKGKQHRGFGADMADVVEAVASTHPSQRR